MDVITTAENTFNNIYKKKLKKKSFGALSKIRDQIQKYVMKDHGFPFLKLCDISQSVQQFCMLELSEVGGKDWRQLTKILATIPEKMHNKFYTH